MKKHQWHCERCYSPLTIYKKGKGHRVLICPHHGVIATNPLPLIAAGLAMKYAPKLLGAAKGLMGGGKLQQAESPSQIARQAGYPYPIKVREPVLVDID